jgi:hypothetical protein
LPVGPGRVKPRVVMPMLAVAGGGMEADKGSVIRALVNALEAAARDLAIDVVLVTPDRSVFSAAQHIRRELSPWALSDYMLQRAQELGRLAAQGHLALFLGAGVSVPAGLPTWDGLLAELMEGDDAGSVGQLKKLPALDQAQVLEKRVKNFGARVAEITRRASRPSLGHALLAGLGCTEVVTTNYDQLYESAAAATGQPAVSLLPWSVATPGHPWVLKMHGDVDHVGSIVLTRRHFVRYDADTRPAGSLLQSLLLTRHLLVVGASLNDDNVSRLAHEVDEFRRTHNLSGTFGTFLDVDGLSARRELWRGQLEWIEMGGAGFPERGRNLEIFLDAVGAHATTDASWLLDARFEGLLSESERDCAAAARDLQARAALLGPAFAPLDQALGALGAAAVPRST